VLDGIRQALASEAIESCGFSARCALISARASSKSVIFNNSHRLQATIVVDNSDDHCFSQEQNLQGVEGLLLTMIKGEQIDEHYAFSSHL
jgi:hypothetical protein